MRHSIGYHAAVTKEKQMPFPSPPAARPCVAPDFAGSRTRADETARDVFESVVGHVDYPCVGAKSVLHRGRVVARGYTALADTASARMLVADLAEFARSADLSAGFTSFIAVFLRDPHCDEVRFETLLWRHLQLARDNDPSAPDPSVSNDPVNPHFAFSVAGSAYFVVGLHPTASRPARRAPLPMLAFNLHEQFEMLRRDGRFNRIRDTIRRRDAAVSGNINPMVADHGDCSEAAQYSGREVGTDWQAPFRP